MIKYFFVLVLLLFAGRMAGQHQRWSLNDFSIELNQLAGFEPKPDGSLWIGSRPAPGETIAIQGFGFREQVIDVPLSQRILQHYKGRKNSTQGKPAHIIIL